MKESREVLDMQYSKEDFEEIITSELAAQQNKFAKQLMGDFGNYMDNNLTNLATLTKQEKKMFKKEKRKKFFTKIKNILLGENDTSFERPY